MVYVCKSEQIAEQVFDQCIKCIGCPFNNHFEPKMRGCGATTCFVDENYQIIYNTTSSEEEK